MNDNRPLELDETELTEVAARAAWENFQKINAEKLPDWENLGMMEKYNVREGVLPVVIALVKHLKEKNV